MEGKTHRCLILLGSNQGWRIWNLNQALFEINCLPGVIVKICSRIYQEKFIGISGPDILNQVIRIETLLPPFLLLEKFQVIEKRLGRKKDKRWSPRIIDIDILDYHNWMVADENLILPHPRLHLRPASLKGITEVFPNWIHPVFNKKASSLLASLDQQFTIYPDVL
ncbi:MAG: hypothetical protein APR63_00750 [Desulfuromonas sp. SDB]|nr:MAG: hypothetical protein APR63_00750 [Desulfuromonas sp. SDB]